MTENIPPIPPVNTMTDNPDFDNISYKITLFVTVITCSLFILYGIINLFMKNFYTGIIEAATGTGVFIFNLIFLLKKKRYKAPATLINTITIALSAYLYWSGGLSHTGIFWCFVLPGLYISTSGLKKGIIWISLQVSVTVILFILSLMNIIETAYNGFETIAALIAYSFSCYVLLTYEIIRNRYKKEISKLKGLLPICTICKRIQDKEGKWQSVDKYLVKKADIDFTHGLCPDCIKKHYSEYS